MNFWIGFLMILRTLLPNLEVDFDFSTELLGDFNFNIFIDEAFKLTSFINDFSNSLISSRDLNLANMNTKNIGT